MHRAYGATQHGTVIGITHRFDFRQDNLAVPDVLSQTHVDIVHERLEFGHFVMCFSGGRFRVFQVPSDSPLRATNLSGNINNIRTLLDHVKVLSAQHADVISGVRTSRKQHVGWSGQSKWLIGDADDFLDSQEIKHVY